MRKLLITVLILLFSASLVSAQEEAPFWGISLGVGVVAPLSGRDIVTEAHNDDTGVVRVDRVLDNSPELAIEVHKAFAITDTFGLGPAFLFAPKFDFGSTSNTTSEQPVGVGLGGVVSVDAGGKRTFNIGLFWMMYEPMDQVSPDFVDGFQAPRDSDDSPISPTFKKSSPNRLVITFTLGGLFG